MLPPLSCIVCGVPEEHGEPAGRAPLRVLVAEDNPVNRKLFAVYLSRLGHASEFAENGREACDKALASPFDVILMDVHMPEMDGWEASRRIRSALAGRSHPLIIAITGDADAEDGQRCRDAGMDGHLPKPVRLEDLAKALEGTRGGRGDTKPSLDARVLEDLARQLGAGGLDAVRDLLAMSRETGGSLLAEMEAAVGARDLARLRLASHSLKTTAASLGAARLESLCRRLEAETRAAQAPDAPPAPGAWGEWGAQVVGIRGELQTAGEQAAAWLADNQSH